MPVPYGLIDLLLGEARSRLESGSAQVGSAQVGTAQVGATEIGVVEISVAQISVAKVSICESSPYSLYCLEEVFSESCMQITV